MDQDKRTINIEILDKQYHVKCQNSEVAKLPDAALHLNRKMREIRNSSNSILRDSGTIALMAALNISDEYLQLKLKQEEYVEMTSNRIQQMQRKIDEALATKQKSDELEF